MRTSPTSHPAAEAAEAIVAAIRRRRFRYSSEVELQEAIATVLAADGFPVEREVRLDRYSRIDLLTGGVGVEIKVAGRESSVLRQLARYAEHDAIAALVLVTNRSRHTFPARWWAVMPPAWCACSGRIRRAGVPGRLCLAWFQIGRRRGR